jgi:hypothetical protein
MANMDKNIYLFPAHFDPPFSVDMTHNFGNKVKDEDILKKSRNTQNSGKNRRKR